MWWSQCNLLEISCPELWLHKGISGVTKLFQNISTVSNYHFFHTEESKSLNIYIFGYDKFQSGENSVTYCKRFLQVAVILVYLLFFSLPTPPPPALQHTCVSIVLEAGWCQLDIQIMCHIMPSEISKLKVKINWYRRRRIETHCQILPCELVDAVQLPSMRVGVCLSETSKNSEAVYISAPLL